MEPFVTIVIDRSFWTSRRKNGAHSSQNPISMAIIDGSAVDQSSQRQDHAQNIAAINHHGNLYCTAYEPIIAKIARGASQRRHSSKRVIYFKIRLLLEKGDFQTYYWWGTVMSLPFKILYRGSGRVWPADEVQSERTSDPVQENMELNMDG